MEEVFTARRKRSRERSVSVESTEDQSASANGKQKSDYFPANKLFEYQWPLGSEGAEYYLLQEQVKEFLDIRGMQRKYPDLHRRNLDLDERKYLVGRGVVTETQSNMGLVALRSEHVLEVMAEDYPIKYEEYQSVLQEREFQATLRTKMMESKRIALMAESRVTMATSQVTNQAIQNVVRFNSQLAEARRVVRKEYADTQTKLTHIPRRPQGVCPAPRLSRYPVALLPGQHCDYIRHYTPGELNKLPLNTVIDVPEVKPAPPPAAVNTLDSVLSQAATSSSILKSLFSIPTSASPNSTPRPSASKKMNISLSNSILSAILSKSGLSMLPHAKVPDSKPAGITVGTGTKSTVAGSSVTMTTNSSKHQTGPGGGGVVTVTGQNQGLGKLEAPSSVTPVLVPPATITKDTVGMETIDVATVDMETVDLAAIDSSSMSSSLVGSPAVGVATVSTTAGGSGVVETTTSSSKVLPVPQEPVKMKIFKPHLCTVCFKSASSNKLGHPEQMLTCSNCKASIHPSCYDLDTKPLPLLRGYEWQCLDCKSCQLCSSADQDDRMMCCDNCDRGYHTFCVGLAEIPEGQWLCKLCTSCASCGSLTPGPDKQGEGTSPASWQYEYSKGKFLQILCSDCSSYFRRGYFCPLCLHVYHDDETDSPMVCCDNCDRWVHTECEDIDEEKYKELSQDKALYVCSLCRGLKEEKAHQCLKRTEK